MNVKKLCEMQEILDQRIMKEHGLEGKNLEDNKILALLVEICELANETRCFKHWSTKGPSEKGILLEEYVDSLHFFLSIANYRQYDVDRLYDVYSSDFALTEAPQSLVASFKDVMSKILEMEQQPKSILLYSSIWSVFTFRKITWVFVGRNRTRLHSKK